MKALTMNLATSHVLSWIALSGMLLLASSNPCLGEEAERGDDETTVAEQVDVVLVSKERALLVCRVAVSRRTPPRLVNCDGSP